MNERELVLRSYPFINPYEHPGAYRQDQHFTSNPVFTTIHKDARHYTPSYAHLIANNPYQMIGNPAAIHHPHIEPHQAKLLAFNDLYHQGYFTSEELANAHFPVNPQASPHFHDMALPENNLNYYFGSHEPQQHYTNRLNNINKRQKSLRKTTKPTTSKPKPPPIFRTIHGKDYQVISNKDRKRNRERPRFKAPTSIDSPYLDRQNHSAKNPYAYKYNSPTKRAYFDTGRPSPKPLIQVKRPTPRPIVVTAYPNIARIRQHPTPQYLESNYLRKSKRRNKNQSSRSAILRAKFLSNKNTGKVHRKEFANFPLRNQKSAYDYINANFEKLQPRYPNSHYTQKPQYLHYSPLRNRHRPQSQDEIYEEDGSPETLYYHSVSGKRNTDNYDIMTEHVFPDHSSVYKPHAVARPQIPHTEEEIYEEAESPETLYYHSVTDRRKPGNKDEQDDIHGSIYSPVYNSHRRIPPIEAEEIYEPAESPETLHYRNILDEKKIYDDKDAFQTDNYDNTDEQEVITDIYSPVYKTNTDYIRVPTFSEEIDALLARDKNTPLNFDDNQTPHDQHRDQLYERKEDIISQEQADQYHYTHSIEKAMVTSTPVQAAYPPTAKPSTDNHLVTTQKSSSLEYKTEPAVTPPPAFFPKRNKYLTSSHLRNLENVKTTTSKNRRQHQSLAVDEDSKIDHFTTANSLSYNTHQADPNSQNDKSQYKNSGDKSLNYLPKYVPEPPLVYYPSKVEQVHTPNNHAKRKHKLKVQYETPEIILDIRQGDYYNIRSIDLQKDVGVIKQEQANSENTYFGKGTSNERVEDILRMTLAPPTTPISAYKRVRLNNEYQQKELQKYREHKNNQQRITSIENIPHQFSSPTNRPYATTTPASAIYHAPPPQAPTISPVPLVPHDDHDNELYNENNVHFSTYPSVKRLRTRRRKRPLWKRLANSSPRRGSEKNEVNANDIPPTPPPLMTETEVTLIDDAPISYHEREAPFIKELHPAMEVLKESQQNHLLRAIEEHKKSAENKLTVRASPEYRDAPKTPAEKKSSLLLSHQHLLRNTKLQPPSKNEPWNNTESHISKKKKQPIETKNNSKAIYHNNY